MNPRIKKFIALCTLAVMSTSILASVSARADGYTCRDYYSSYVDQATSPAPVVVVDARPNYHGHYPEYRGNERGNDNRGNDNRGSDNHDGNKKGNNNNKDNSNNDAAAAIAVVAILAALSTTTAAQDAELQDANNVINDIDQSQLGDGAQLRQLTAKVQADMPAGKTASEADVAAAVNSGNQSHSFCQTGDLDSESDLAASIATTLSAK